MKGTGSGPKGREGWTTPMVVASEPTTGGGVWRRRTRGKGVARRCRKPCKAEEEEAMGVCGDAWRRLPTVLARV